MHRITKVICDILLSITVIVICVKQFPGHPLINFFNDYFEVYLFFKLKELCFVKNNRGNCLIADVFISYDL